MKILILGAGKIGFGVANYLKTQGSNVTVIEKKEDIAFKIKNNYGIDVVIGDAMDAELLKKAGIEQASVIVASLPFDEQNLVVCKIADAAFNVKTKIARLREKTFLQNDLYDIFLKENFGVDIIIKPEIEVAKYVSNTISINGAFDVIDFDQTVLIGLKCLENTLMLNTPMMHFYTITNIDFFVLTIFRNKKLMFPNKNSMLIKDDEIYIAIDKKNVDKVMQLFGYEQTLKKKILILGGGFLDIYLLKEINNFSKFEITIVENSIEKAEMIAQMFPNVSVILGDVLDYSLLKEISVNSDMAIISTDKDRINVLSSLFLKKIGRSKVFTLCKNINYKELLEDESEQCIINPDLITISSIISQARKGKITSVKVLSDYNSVNVLEVFITEDFIKLGENILNVFKQQTLIPICLIRNKEVFFHFKNFVFQTNDQLIMLASKRNIKKIETLFSTQCFSTKAFEKSIITTKVTNELSELFEPSEE